MKLSRIWLISTFLCLQSIAAMAICENDQIKIALQLSEDTRNRAYYANEELVLFAEGDFIEIHEKEKNLTTVIHKAYMSDDMAGNFTINGYLKNSSGNEVEVINLYYDHEVWEEVGIGTSFESFKTNQTYDLSRLKCSFYDLLK